MRYSRIAVAAMRIASSRVSAPTTRYGPARLIVSAAAQPETPAPWRTRPSGRGPLQVRARSWSSRCVRRVRSAPGFDDVEHHLDARPHALDEVRLGHVVERLARLRRNGFAAAAGSRMRRAGRRRRVRAPRRRARAAGPAQARARPRGGRSDGGGERGHRLPEDTPPRRIRFPARAGPACADVRSRAAVRGPPTRPGVGSGAFRRRPWAHDSSQDPGSRPRSSGACFDSGACQAPW